MFLLDWNSNTSYVLIHRRIRHTADTRNVIQIHPMFLFIPFPVFSRRPPKSFKYILCSYSSKGWEEARGCKIFKYILCSYSSAGIVGGGLGNSIFKYILCSYSSQVEINYKKWLYKFKYILCSYSSTAGREPDYILAIQIHPMFLFIKEKACPAVVCIAIQIHPMFLFICIIT